MNNSLTNLLLTTVAPYGIVEKLKVFPPRTEKIDKESRFSGKKKSYIKKILKFKLRLLKSGEIYKFKLKYVIKHQNKKTNLNDQIFLYFSGTEVNSNLKDERKDTQRELLQISYIFRKSLLLKLREQDTDDTKFDVELKSIKPLRIRLSMKLKGINFETLEFIHTIIFSSIFQFNFSQEISPTEPFRS